MMPRFMLDTDTCSYIMKRSHPLVLKRLQTFSVDDVLPGLDLGLGASNVLDARWAAPGGFEHVQPFLPQDGRVVWAKLTATF